MKNRQLKKRLLTNDGLLQIQNNAHDIAMAKIAMRYLMHKAISKNVHIMQDPFIDEELNLSFGFLNSKIDELVNNQ